jgi:protein-disulfide isomerase-like protein with CxxC motif
MVDVLHLTDPGCPWAWSASPAIAALRWRFGDGLRWRHAMIGLTERAEQYEQRGYTPLQSALGHRRFRVYGMPFASHVKSRVSATAPACRVVVAARLRDPELEFCAFRALQTAHFTTASRLEDRDDLRAALDRFELPGDDLVAAIDDDEVVAAYEADRALARSAAGTPPEVQNRTANTDGAVRFTAPSLVFSRDGTRMVAGGFQPLEAYDTLLAHLAPDLPRRGAPLNVAEMLAEFPEGLFTAEAAHILRAHHLDVPDIAGAEERMIEAMAQGVARRIDVGDSALWTQASGATKPPSVAMPPVPGSP